jgi:hypothetical protein
MQTTTVKAAILLVMTTGIAGSLSAQVAAKPSTFANPLNLDYGSGRARRGGEPVVILDKNDYYLFVSGAGGYWYSSDMREWSFVAATNLPIVNSPPSVIVIGDRFYFTSSARPEVYATTEPKKGVWHKVADLARRYGDADLFLDDDGRVYMYYGWSQLEPITVVELDPKNGFKEIGQPVLLFWGNPTENGWERRRTDDLPLASRGNRTFLPEEAPWIEGPWMSKYRGKYYLQYAAGGVQFVTYADGIYVSDKPIGPFTYSQHNPFSFKPTGFIPGAGHGSTFQDKQGNYWHIDTMVSSYGGSVRNLVGLFPADVDADGVLHCTTEFGDYPQYLPGIKQDAIRNNFTGWMLLSRNKLATASSFLPEHEVQNAVDENVFTYWAAKSGDPGEYMVVDLGKAAEIYALQVNFDMHGASPDFVRSTKNPRYQSYTIHVSNDNRSWSLLVDRSNNNKDAPHEYLELAKAVTARYVKLTNVFTPGGGNFAVKDLRVFGNPKQAKYSQADNVTIARDPQDRRTATVTWKPVEHADGYIVRYGTEPDKLYNNYMVYDNCSLNMHSLDKNAEYYFMVEAFGSGTDYYRESSTKTQGLGVELELLKDGQVVGRKALFEGTNKYYFDNVEPGHYVLRHGHGGILWEGELAAKDVMWKSAYPGVSFDGASGTENKATQTQVLFKTGRGSVVLGEAVLKVLPGLQSGRIGVFFQ